MQSRKSYIIAALAVVLALALIISLYVSTKNTTDTTEIHKIGVVVYDINDSEVQMFRGYYENYISDSFPVEFIYSASVGDWNDEKAFIEEATAAGAEGFISFFATNLTEAVKLCEKSGVYYMMGSGNIEQELFDKVADNKYFLGCIGPNDATDYQAGTDMVNAYAKENGTADTCFVVVTGGTAYGNHMHEMRARGILNTLSRTYGLTYTKTVDQAVMSTEITELETGVSGIKIIICPGYDVPEKLEQTLANYNADAVLSVLASDSLDPLTVAAEKAQNHNIWLGLVDCFSQWNYELFNSEDSFGNSRINYLSGKYASEIGPSFAAMFQAVSGNAESLRQNGKAFHLNQGFWTASNAEEFNELYAYTQSYALNAYSNTDIMSVITAYNEKADFSSFKALTEAYSFDQALKRLEAN